LWGGVRGVGGGEGGGGGEKCGLRTEFNYLRRNHFFLLVLPQKPVFHEE